MAIERWRPGRGLRIWRPGAVFEEMERLMDELMRRPFFPATWWRVPTEELAWAPAMEMYEREDKIVVRAELPGMKKEEIDISVVGDTLTISGERKASSEVKNEDYYRCELCYGKFTRALPLPTPVEADKVKATYEDGILEITLPKVAVAKPKKIAIETKSTKETKLPKSK